jgi:hypothetical protein
MHPSASGNASLSFKGASLSLKGASLSFKGASLRLRDAPFSLRGASLSLEGASLGLRDASLDGARRGFVDRPSDFVRLAVPCLFMHGTLDRSCVGVSAPCLQSGGG